MNTTEELVFCRPGFKVAGQRLPNGKTCTRWIKPSYAMCWRCYQRLRRDDSEWDDDEEEADRD